MKSIFLKYSLLTLLFIFGINYNILSQNESLFQTNYKYAPNIEGSNYYTIVKEKRKEFSEIKSLRPLTRSENKAYKHFERWAYFWKDRVGNNGSFPSALEGWKNLGLLGGRNINSQNDAISSRSSWVNIGPQVNPSPNGYPNPPQLGRLQAFWRYVDAGNANNNILIVGAPTGGIWKSSDNGATWSPKFDNFAGIGITDIKGSSNSVGTPGVLYASTGDFDGSSVLNSIGVYKSTDMGDTWMSTGLSYTLDGTQLIGHLIVYDDLTVVAATSNSIKKTIDGGNTWTDKLYEYDGRFGRMASSGTNIVCTNSWGGVHFSTNSGDNWNELVGYGGFSKTSVTVDESGTFYIQNNNGQIQILDLTGAGSVSNFGNPTTSYDSQGGYNQTLIKRTRTSDNTTIFLSGSVNGYSSADNASTWYNSLNGYNTSTSDPGVYVHSDHHQMGYLDDGFSFWDCHDGGLDFVTYSSASDQSPSHTYKSEGVIVTQVYTISIDPTLAASDDYMMANQDNDGFSKEAGSWVSASAGDGVCSAIDHSTPGIRYLGGTTGSLTRSDNTGYTGNYVGTSIPKPATAEFVWPFSLNTTDPTIAYGGFDDMYKSTNISTTTSSDPNAIWTKLNAGVGNPITFDNQGDFIAVVGKTGITRSSDGGNTWTPMNQPSGGQEINSFSIDAASIDGKTIYATVKGYSVGNKVFKTIDGGQTWSNISGNMPNIVMKKIILYQNQTSAKLYVGTELGVYNSLDGGTTWSKSGGSSFPNVIVNDLKINPLSAKLIVGTYGRGLWSIDIDAAVPIELMSFLAKTNKEEVKLVWETASEINYNSFDILHSINGIDWKSIGSIEGKGTFSSHNIYEFIDYNPKVGLNYYRLKLINKDGSFEFSKVVNAIINSEKLTFSLSPNPIKSGGLLLLNLNSPTIEKNVLTIFNSIGQKVFQTLIISDEKNISIQLPNLISATYYVQVRNKTNIQVDKLVIN